MEIEDSDSDYHSAGFKVTQKMVDYRQLPQGYVSNSGEESEQELVSHASDPAEPRPLHFDYETLIWKKFWQLVLNGAEAPPGVLEGPDTDAFCEAQMERMYIEAVESMFFEDDCANRFA